MYKVSCNSHDDIEEEMILRAKVLKNKIKYINC